MDSFDQALERLDKYIWYMAHRYSKTLQGMEVSDLHQVGLIKLYEVYSSSQYSGKPAEELDAIFKRALHNMYVDMSEKSNEEVRTFVHLDLEDISSHWGYRAFDDLYVQFYQEHMAKHLSSDAVILLEHLLHPTPAVYHMHNIQRMRREALQSQGFKVRVPQKLTQLIVGKTLGFSASKTKALIRELKQTWRAECQTVIHNWKPNAVMS